jgi:iron complex outermembrane recepter protein
VRDRLKITARARVLSGVTLAALWAGTAGAQAASGAPDQATVAGTSVDQAVDGQAGPSALAQGGGDIVVTGIRQSIRSAISEKRDAINVVNVINAEDVGKLPDQNLAEVLENVTGIQIDRSAGVGSSVSIRGSSQNLVLINGRVTTPSGDARGGISFDDVPAEIIASVRVTKVPTADQVEGSVGGIVDLRTYRGLGLKQPLAAIRAQMEYADQADRYNPTVSGVFGRTFDTGIGAIGVVLSGSYQTQDVREDTLNVRYAPRTGVDVTGDGIADPYLAPNFVGQYFLRRHRENKTVSGSTEWQATSALKLFVDGTYVNQQNDGDQPGVFLQPPLTELPLTNAAFDMRRSGGVSYRQMTRGTLSGVQFRSTGESPTRDTESYLVAGGGEWEHGPLTLKFEASRAGSDTLDANFQLVAQYSNPGAGFNTAPGRISPPLLFDLTRDDLYLAPDASSPLAANLANPAYYSTFIARDNYTRFHNVENAQRVDLHWSADLGPLKSIDVGARLNQTDSRRDKTTQVSATFPGVSAASQPGLYRQAPTDFFDFTGDRYLGGFVVAGALTDDPAAARAAVGLAATPPEDLSARFSVKERTYAGYGKLNLEGDTFGMNVRAELGARYVHTKQTASGLLVTGGTSTPRVATQGYSYLLPDAILSLQPVESVLLRASYGRSLRRPDFSQLAPSAVFPVVANYVSVGNPDLKPQTVDQFDAAVEWYFDRNSIFSVGGFYKKYHDLVVTIAQPPVLRDEAVGFFNQANCIGGIFNPVAVDLTGAVGICTGVNQPQNQGDATLKGIEVDFQHSFTYLPGALSGFGVIANYTYQDGKRSVPFTVPAALVGGQLVTIPFGLRELSKNNYNVTLFFEKYGINARVRYTYRDPFLRTEATDVTNNLPLYQDKRSQVNASVSIDINPKFAVTFSGVNLTASPNKENAIFIDGPLTQERIADRRFVVGVRGVF